MFEVEGQQLGGSLENYSNDDKYLEKEE